jgi:hypothetical protein
MKIELDADALIRHLENLLDYCEQNDLNGYATQRIVALLDMAHDAVHAKVLEQVGDCK